MYMLLTIRSGISRTHDTLHLEDDTFADIYSYRLMPSYTFLVSGVPPAGWKKIDLKVRFAPNGQKQKAMAASLIVGEVTVRAKH